MSRDEDGNVTRPSSITRSGLGVLGMDVQFNPDKGTV
jgi:hypothetical protein